MDTFTPPLAPSVGSSTSHKPRILAADFGDGYSVRAGDGLNADLATLNLTWDVLKVAQADAIESFLAAHKGYLPFLWTAPRDSAPKKWTCPNWDRPMNTVVDTITATFKQVVDP